MPARARGSPAGDFREEGRWSGFRIFLSQFESPLVLILVAAAAISIADFVPSSVIKGLLAAIGLILILKQIPHLVGHDTNPLGMMSFEEPDHENTFSELVHLFRVIHPGAAVIGAD